MDIPLRTPTKKQMECLELIAAGKSRTEIAAILGIKMAAVEHRLNKTMRAANVFKATALVATAFRNGWIR